MAYVELAFDDALKVSSLRKVVLGWARADKMSLVIPRIEGEELILRSVKSLRRGSFFVLSNHCANYILRFYEKKRGFEGERGYSVSGVTSLIALDNRVGLENCIGALGIWLRGDAVERALQGELGVRYDRCDEGKRVERAYLTYNGRLEGITERLFSYARRFALKP